MIVLFCTGHSASILQAWRHSPFDKLGWMAFLVWLGPLLLGLGGYRATSGPKETDSSLTPWLLGSALILVVAGIVSSLNALKYAALACSLVGLLRWNAWNLVWLVAAVSWMPWLGWVGGGMGSHTLPGLRLAVAAAGMLCGCRALMKRSPAEPS